MIIERIKQKIEANMYITPNTTPIVYFGNYENSKVCTISLNPSDGEFEKNHNILRKTFNKRDNQELSDEDAIQVLQYCNKYFTINPYRSWFDPFDTFIKHFGNYSYYDGTCVHLDLVQWATTPHWSKLPDNVKQKHLENDLPILKHLLSKEFEIMFLNGITVVDNISHCLGIRFSKKNIQFVNNKHKTFPIEIYSGKYNNTNVIGWNLVLQSHAIGGYNNINLMGEKIKNNI